ncbi:g5979 [Coccomyxa elongata]
MQHPGLRDRVAGYRARIQHECWDTAAWEALVAEISEAAERTPSPELLAEQKAVLEDFLGVFPTAAVYWQKYADIEIRAGNESGAKSVFSRCLLTCLSVELWRTYLRFIKQINEARGPEGMEEVRKAYEFTLEKIGSDIGAGPLWQEYIAFLQGPPPGSPAFLALFSGGVAGQEETQRLTLVRRAFQKALVVPCGSLDMLWRSYEQFEQSSSNKTLARRILDEQRPRYQAARDAYAERARLLQPIASNALAVPPGVWLEFSRWHAAEGGSGPAAAASVLSQGRKALPSCLLLHFAAADLEDSRGGTDAARRVYEDLVAGLVPKEEATPEQQAGPQLTPELGGLAWIQYMRWARRADSVNASRKVFVRCRKWRECPWQVYAANALMEWQSERADKIPRNIFELGLKSFLGSAGFVLAYADWLLSINDVDNARQLFERALAAVADPDGRPDADLQPRIWERYIQVEYQTGKFSAVAELEERRRNALGDQPHTETVRLALLKYRYMDLWPCTDNDRHYLQQLLGLGPGPSAGGVVSGQAQVPPSPPAASRQLPAQPPPQPPVLVPLPGPHQPITQIPRELGNLINALPPVHALEGNAVDVDAVIEVLMGADLSPAAAAASEAAAHSHAFSSQSRQPQQLPAPPVLRPPDAGPGCPRKRPWPDAAADARGDSGNGEGPAADSAAAHDIYRARRKQRTKASPLHG